MIWPPDWSQFLPDLINALFTGAVLALVVWALERRRESKEAQRRAIDEWTRATPSLKPLVSMDLELLPGTSYSNPARDLRDALRPYPTTDWARVLPKHEPVTGLATLEVEWPRLFEAQTRVQNLIPAAVKAATPSGQPQDSHLEGIVASLVRGRISGEQTSNNTAAWSTLQSWGWSQGDVAAWIARSLEDVQLASAIETLRAGYVITSAAYEAVRAAVL